MKRVVNVRTQKEWDGVTKKLGYNWMVSKWNNNRENSCICLHENSHASIKFFKKEGYKIISYDEFMGNKNKEYKLIITPTNSTIIIDKETGRKGMARLHPDDKYNFLEGVRVAMDKLNEVEPKKIRTVGELPVGTKIKILNETQGWGYIKEGDIGILINTNTATWNGEKAVAIEFNENKNWILNSGVKEGEYFEVIEEDEKLILSEPEFKKGIVNKPNMVLWNNKYIINEINNIYGVNTVIVDNNIKSSIIVNIIGKSKFKKEDIYIVEYDNKQYVVYCYDVEKYKPKLYDSFGEELNEGDRLILIDLENNKKYTDELCYVESDGEELFSNGIRTSHNSNCNDGKPTDEWKVIKIK